MFFSLHLIIAFPFLSYLSLILKLVLEKTIEVSLMNLISICVTDFASSTYEGLPHRLCHMEDTSIPPKPSD